MCILWTLMKILNSSTIFGQSALPIKSTINILLWPTSVGNVSPICQTEFVNLINRVKQRLGFCHLILDENTKAKSRHVKVFKIKSWRWKLRGLLLLCCCVYIGHLTIYEPRGFAYLMRACLPTVIRLTPPPPPGGGVEGWQGRVRYLHSMWGVWSVEGFFSGGNWML